MADAKAREEVTTAGGRIALEASDLRDRLHLELRWRRGRWSRIRELEEDLERLEAGERAGSSRA